MKPLFQIVVTICLVLAIKAHPENIAEVKELPQTKEPVVEAEESDPQARVERCSACSPNLKLNIKSPKDVLAAIKQLPGEVHTQESFESCSSDKGCAGIKVKDGRIIEKFGKLEAFKQAAAQDLGNEFSFHAAGADSNSPFWWMNQNSPFKGAGSFGKFSKSSSYTTAGSGTLDNPSYQSSFSKQSFSSSSNGAVDLAGNPFLNGDFGRFNAAGLGQEAGYVGSSPTPFTTSSGSNYFENDFQSSGSGISSQNIGGSRQTCAGEGYTCVPRSQCNNGEVNTNGINVLQASSQKQYCDLQNEICCRIVTPGSGSFQGSFGSSSSQGSNIFSTGSEQGFASQGSSSLERGFNSASGGSSNFGAQGNFGSSSNAFGSNSNSFGSSVSANRGSSFDAFDASRTNNFGSVGSTVTPITPFFNSNDFRNEVSKSSSQSNFIETDAIAAGSENNAVFGPGQPYLPPVSSTNFASPTTPSTFVATPTFTPRPITPRPFPTPTYLPPVSSTSGPGYLPPSPTGEASNPKETRVPTPRPTYNDGSLILDASRQPTVRPPVRPVPPPVAPSDIPAGCAAALKCTAIEYCTAEGVISTTPIALTREQEAYRVPLTDCRDLQSGIIGKCCRDPTYTDPWPTNQLGKWVPGVFGGDDGRYVPDNRGSPSTNIGPQIRPTDTTGSTIQNAFRTSPRPTSPTFGPNQITPGYPSSTVTPFVQKNQFGSAGQGQYSKTGAGVTSQSGFGVSQTGQVSQTGFGQRGQTGQFGVGQTGQVGTIALNRGTQGQFAKGTQTTQLQGQGFKQSGGQSVTQGSGFLQTQGIGQVNGLAQSGSQGFGQQATTSQFGAGQYGQGSVGQVQQTGQGKFGSRGSTGTFGQGQTVSQSRGTGVQQGFGTATQQGFGTATQQGFGNGFQQTGGSAVQQGFGSGVRQGAGTATQQGGGLAVQQGFGTASQQGGGSVVQQGFGSGVRQGSGTVSQQGFGSGARQGSGSVSQQGFGFGVQQGGGLAVQQGFGSGVRQGSGSGFQQGAGLGVQQGFGNGIQQGFGNGVRQGGGAGVVSSQGSGSNQGGGQGFGIGSGQYDQSGSQSVLTQGGGYLGQGSGNGFRQQGGGSVTGGAGVFGSQGLGTGVRYQTGQQLVAGRGQALTEGKGEGVKKGEGQIITQGEGQTVTQGEGQIIKQGGGQYTTQQLVSQGQGEGIRQSGGAIITQGQGQTVKQGGGFIVTQGQGETVKQGGGQYVTQGSGQIVKQGEGQYVTQGQGQIVKQGGGQYVTQGEGQIITQGGGQYVTQGGGQYVKQGSGQYVTQGQGQTLVQGFGSGLKQGQGFLVSQGGGAGYENEYSASTQRVFLQKYTGTGECGLLNPQKPYGNRNDLEVDFAEIPWQAMVLLQTNRSLLCGGVITRPEVVVTSASCVEGLDAKNVLIKGGEWKLGIDDEPLPFQIVQVKTIIRHPEYKPGSLKYDAAILVLSENLRFAKNIQPICLPSKEDTLDAFYNGAGECIVTGWGKIVLQAHLSGSIMHSLNVSLINPGECEAKLSQDYPHLLEQYDQDSCVCGQPTNPLNNICKVDIGSALACSTGDSHFVLRGVYSWDSGCQIGNQVAGFYKFDIEWYEWAIGLIESVRFSKYTIGTKVTQSKITSQVVKTGQFSSGLKGSVTGIKGVVSGIGATGSNQFGQFQSGSGTVFGQFPQGAGLKEFGQFSQGQFTTGAKGVETKGQGEGQFSQFGSTKFTELKSGEGALDFGTQIKGPISKTFTTTYKETKVFQSEPKYVTYTTKPEIVTFTTKPEYFTFTTKPKIVTYTTKPKIVTYTTKPEIVTYTTKPEIVTYTTKPEIVTYTTKPEYFTYTTKPKIVSYTTKPQFITYETSGSGTNPRYVAPGVTFNPSFSDVVGKHKHNNQCKCLEGKP